MPEDSVKPRKLPVQARSRKRVETILKATAAILVESGHEALTAVGIAEKANIPVASIYQYFPNKESILYALCEDMMAEVLARFDEYQQYDRHNMTADELIAVMGEREYSDPAKHRLEFELNRAMLAIPMLSELQRSFDQELSKRLSGIFVHYGSQWSQEELTNLSRIIFRMGNTYFDHVNKTKNDSVLVEQSRLLILKAVNSLVHSCLMSAPDQLKANAGQ